MHEAALDERVGGRLERLRVELVVGEPAVGAGVEELQRGAAVGGHGGQRIEHRRVGQRARRPRGRLGPARRRQSRAQAVRQLALDRGAGHQRLGVGDRPVGGERPRQLVLRGRLGERVDHAGQVAAAGRDLGPGLEQALQLVEQRRARLGGAVLVAVAVAEEEGAAGQREAGAEEVALLGLALAAGVEAELQPLRLGEEGVGAAVAARELAVLQGGEEDVVEAPGAKAVGAGDPHPSLDRARPDAEGERLQRRRQLRRAGAEVAELGQLGQGRGDRRRRAQLEAVAGAERRPVVAAAQRPRGHRRRQRPDRGAERGGEEAASRRRLRSRGGSPSSPCQSSSALAASSTRLLRSARSNQSTRRAGTPEGPRR